MPCCWSGRRQGREYRRPAARRSHRTCGAERLLRGSFGDGEAVDGVKALIPYDLGWCTIIDCRLCATIPDGHVIDVAVAQKLRTLHASAPPDADRCLDLAQLGKSALIVDGI